MENITIPIKTCDNCNGSGEILVRVPNPEGVKYGRVYRLGKCVECDGSGLTHVDLGEDELV